VPDRGRLAVAFARVLRGVGIDVPLGATMLFAEALPLVGVDDGERVYWSGRAIFVKRPDDIAAYDSAFAVFFLGAPATFGDADTTDPHAIVAEVDAALPDSDDEIDADDERPVVTLRWSAAETLRHVDFAAYTAAEFAEARKLMADLRLARALKPTRRRRPAHKQRGRPDVRRTVRRALQTGGEPIQRRYVVPTAHPRRIVLLLDVSGSMEPYARAFVRFLHAAVVGRGRVEAFALGTRVTRITRELSSRDPDAAVRAAAARVVDWAGGTRLGDGLRAFNDTWGIRGLARGAIVVVLSDGWDRGHPERLGEQMARLARVAHKVVWVNPLKASPGYAPLAQGMAAALPYVDAFVEGHSLAALEDVTRMMAE
jgi:uncharacterized protein with von Willebrand factor type A (vWA) domain